MKINHIKPIDVLHIKKNAMFTLILLLDFICCDCNLLLKKTGFVLLRIEPFDTSYNECTNTYVEKMEQVYRKHTAWSF